MADPTPAAVQASWVPSRKVIASGLAGIVAWAIFTVAAHYNIQLPLDQTALTGIIMWVVAYVTPPSLQDVLRRLNNDVVKAAQDDPDTPVSKPAVPLASDPVVKK